MHIAVKCFRVQVCVGVLSYSSKFQTIFNASTQAQAQAQAHTKCKEDFELNTCCASEVYNLITAFTYYFNMAHPFNGNGGDDFTSKFKCSLLAYVAEVTDLNYG